jgi:hypothetical protein
VHLLGEQVSLLVFGLRLVAGRRAREEHMVVSDPPKPDCYLWVWD